MSDTLTLLRTQLRASLDALKPRYSDADLGSIVAQLRGLADYGRKYKLAAYVEAINDAIGIVEMMRRHGRAEGQS